MNLRQAHPGHVEVRLDAALDAPGRARAALRRLPLAEELRADVDLVVSELVTNSVVHAAGPIVVTVAVGPPVRVEVHDRGPGFEWRPAATPARRAHGGRGLPLVDLLAARWGVERRDGCVVWAELGTP